jgi:formylglycine-generating enzyme required for sulfatase activity
MVLHSQCSRGIRRGDADQVRFVEALGIPATTQAEWECACRAGTTTSRYHGFSTELLVHYAQFQDNSATHVSPSARLLPNDFSLFDMLGNAYEWCQDPAGDNEPIPDDWLDNQPETIATRSRRLRGGAFGFHAAYNRSSFCGRSVPSDSLMFYGFRQARTVR